MKVADLPKRPLPGMVLYCWKCGSEYSAGRDDSVFAEPTDVLKCECGQRLTLVIKRMTYERVKYKDGKLILNPN